MKFYMFTFFTAIILAQIVFSNKTSAKNLTSEIFFYVGTYTNGESKGIYLYKMNTESGVLEKVNVTENVINPSFISIDRTRNCLYAVNEISDYDNSNSGSISAFKIDQATKQLTLLNTKSSNGADPCFITVDKENGFVLTANYSGGNISLNPTDESGSLLGATDIVQHYGSSINQTRQNKPHTHSIIFNNSNKYAYAADLGVDKIFVYSINLKEQKLALKSQTNLEPGSGPRHLAFHPNGKYAFVINELNNKIVSYSVDEFTGFLNEIGSYSTLPENFSGKSYCSDIHIHENGKYLYGSNRGDNTIAIFEIDETTGILKNIGFESTRGKWPRNFSIDPTGKFLLVANQKSNNITVFKINTTTGLLEYTSINESVPSPVCIQFYDNDK